MELANSLPVLNIAIALNLFVVNENLKNNFICRMHENDLSHVADNISNVMATFRIFTVTGKSTLKRLGLNKTSFSPMIYLLSSFGPPFTALFYSSIISNSFNAFTNYFAS